VVHGSQLYEMTTFRPCANFRVADDPGVGGCLSAEPL
jgi:hypothetical protein